MKIMLKMLDNNNCYPIPHVVGFVIGKNIFYILAPKTADIGKMGIAAKMADQCLNLYCMS